MLGIIAQLILKLVDLVEAQACAVRRAVHRLALGILFSAGAVALGVVGVLTVAAALAVVLAQALGAAWALFIVGAILLLTASAGLQLSSNFVRRRR